MKQKEVKYHSIKVRKESLSVNQLEYKPFFESLLDNLSDIIIQTDNEGRVVFINKSFNRNSAQKIIGEKIIDLLPIEERIRADNILNSILTWGHKKEFEFANGSSGNWYQARFGPVVEENKIIGANIILHDTTEFKLAKEAKRAEEDFISKLIEITHTIVLVLDNLGSIVNINPYLEDISGYTLAEIKGKDWFSLFIPVEEQDRIKGLFKDALSDENISGVVNSILTKDGTIKTIEWYNKTLKDVEGNNIGLLSIGHDITDRLAAEEALKTSKTQLFNAMMIAKIGYWEYDFINDLFSFNDQFYGVFKTSVDNVGGYTMSADRYIELFVYPDDRKKIIEFISKAKLPDSFFEDQQIEHRIIFNDGSTGYISVKIIALRDDSGTVFKIFGANQDITERVSFEEAIRTSEMQLSNAMKIAHLGYWEFDVLKNIFIFNDHFYSIFHTTAEKVGGYTMTPAEYSERFLYPEDRKLVSEETIKAIETTNPDYSRQLEHRIIYANGEIGYISVSFYIIKDKNGKTIKTYGANQDITERKKIEQKLEEQNAKYAALNMKLEESLDIVRKMNIEMQDAKNRAEENDKLKSAFLANMSHEIRTPMNGIIGFAKMLNKKGLSDERRMQYTDIINEMSHQLLHMIDEIIDISKIETGQLVIHKTKTNINDIFIRLFSFYKSTAEKNNINLYVQKGLSDDHSEILTDSTKFRQILDNLLINAIKFTHQGYVKFGYHLKEDGNLEFYVEDTGIGIAPEMQVTIFERFRQVEDGLAKMYGGTGLGLSISKAFIEKLGGSIRLTSIPGKGSTFYFTLPYVPTNINGVHFLEDTKNNNQDIPTILVVEDEEINYLLIEEVLIESNVKIVHAKRGKEAIKIYSDNIKIDLVLLDIKLPDISGFDVMKEMKKLRSHIPIIAQTAYALSGDMESALEAGFDDYIIKPIDEIELLRKIEYFITLSKKT